MSHNVANNMEAVELPYLVMGMFCVLGCSVQYGPSLETLTFSGRLKSLN